MNTLNFNRATMIGFERLINELERSFTNTEPKFPKYNIIRVDDNKFAIECALAGYSIEELDVEVLDNKLHIKSSKEETEEQKTQYIHRGIAKRKFEIKFQLNEFVEVIGAKMENGLLIVNLEQVVPEEKKARKINIE